MELKIIIISCALLLGSCDKSEKNVIVGKPPFFHVTLTYSEGKAERTIDAVRSFAEKNDMNFLLAQKSLEAGDFNASANSRAINLKAMHVAAVSGRLEVFAIARDEPTPEQKALVSEFVASIKNAQSAGHTGPSTRSGN